MAQVEPGSPAEAAGLKRGDRIRKVNGRTNIADEKLRPALPDPAALHDLLVVDWPRGRKELTLTVERGTDTVELAPFTRKQQYALGDLRVTRFRRGMLRLLGAGLFGSVRLWKKYLEVAYPGAKPADWDTSLGRIDAMLREPGRMKAMRALAKTRLQCLH